MNSRKAGKCTALTHIRSFMQDNFPEVTNGLGGYILLHIFVILFDEYVTVAITGCLYALQHSDILINLMLFM